MMAKRQARLEAEHAAAKEACRANPTDENKAAKYASGAALLLRRAEVDYEAALDAFEGAEIVGDEDAIEQAQERLDVALASVEAKRGDS